MGIQYLQSYVRRVVARHNPGAVKQTVSLSELATEFHERNPGAEAVVAIVAHPVFFDLYNSACSQQPWLGAGNFDALVSMAKGFTDSIRACGLKPVFFFDASPNDHIDAMSRIHRGRLATGTRQLFDLLERRQPVPDQVLKDIYSLPEGVRDALAYILRVHCQAEVRLSFLDYIHYSPSLAHYAKENNCAALIGNNADFIVLDIGSVVYLTTGHFDYKHMRASVYDGVELCRYLNLSPQHLRLFSMLLGNGIVLRHELDAFHRRLIRRGAWANGPRQFNALVPAVAEYLRGFEPGECTRRNLRNIVVDAFGDDRHLELVGQYMESAFPHDADDADRPEGGENNQLILAAKTAAQEQRLSLFCYRILAQKVFDVRCCMEKDSLPSTAVLLRPLRQYAYWVLLQETDGDDTVKELGCHPNMDPNEPEIVSAQPIANTLHPGLHELWFGASEDIVVERWLMVQNALALSSEQMRQIIAADETLIVPLLTLSHLNQLAVFNEFELDALLATVLAQRSVVGHHGPGDRLVAISNLGRTSTHAIHIGSLFVRTVIHVSWLLEAVGLVGNQISREFTFPDKHYDGLTFQLQYQAFEKGNLHDIDTRTLAVKLMRVIDNPIRNAERS